jgi:phosphatidylethanolamine N-methyltransferase
VLIDWRSVRRPESINFTSVRNTLTYMVPLCLDSDPSLIPLSCQRDGQAVSDVDKDCDPDDFRFWSERQAKRICVAIKHAFDVDYSPDVIVADANITALANRLLTTLKGDTDAQ